MTGYDALTIMRYILLVIAAAPIILTIVVVVGGQTSWPRGELTAVLAITGVTLVIVRGFIIRPGQPPASIGLSTLATFTGSFTGAALSETAATF